MKKTDWKMLALIGITGGMSLSLAPLQADVSGVSPAHHAHDCKNGCPNKPAPKPPGQDSRKYYNNQTGPRNPDPQLKDRATPPDGSSDEEVP